MGGGQKRIWNEPSNKPYLKGANKGNVKAQYKVGVFYWFGKGRKRNFKEVVKWYSLAAKKGYPAAVNNLGVACEHGFGTQKDLDRALACYRRAAEHGSAKGYENLVRLSKKTGKTIPAGVGNRQRLGCFDFQKFKKWVRLDDDKEKKEQMTGKSLDFKAWRKEFQAERLSIIFYDISLILYG